MIHTCDYYYYFFLLIFLDVQEHHSRNYTGPRITISGASVNHDRFNHYASQFFVSFF